MRSVEPPHREPQYSSIIAFKQGLRTFRNYNELQPEQVLLLFKYLN